VANTVEPRNEPYIVELRPSEYWWCSCGLTQRQPFCDGTHEAEHTGMKPLKVEVSKRQEVSFCGCRKSKGAPYCDGTHKTL